MWMYDALLRTQTAADYHNQGVQPQDVAELPGIYSGSDRFSMLAEHGGAGGNQFQRNREHLFKLRKGRKADQSGFYLQGLRMPQRIRGMERWNISLCRRAGRAHA